MIIQKSARPRAFLIAATLAVTLLGAALFASPAQDRKNHAQFDPLRQKAWSEGGVRVIVRFDVPDYDVLAAASTKFGMADISTAAARQREAADQALRKAVDYYAWKLVTELQGTDFQEIRRFDFFPLIALRVSPNALALLEASADVLGIEEDVAVKLVDPVEEAGASVKGTDPSGGAPVPPMLAESALVVQAKALWDVGITGAGWYVAILDTGIRPSHQFFAGKNIVEACRALGSDGNPGAGDCPNGLSEQNGPGSAVHYSSSYSGWDHGTHVAGIAAGNTGMLAGIAKNANIIAVKVFSRFPASQCGGSVCVLAWSSDTIAGLNYVYLLRGSYNIAAANLSLGGGGYGSFCDGQAYKTAIDLLRSAGIATAIATGNDAYCYGVSSPGCISTSVSVGSSTKTDAESGFNNWHPTLQRLFAPGSSINSSTADSDSSYESWNGTSMATPHVTGAWALMKQALPGGTVTSFLDALRLTGKAVYSSCDGYGAAIPRIKIFDALTFLSSYTLVIQASDNGTTTPVPAVYHYPRSSTVQVTAVPAQYSTFIEWIGDAFGSTNPISVPIDRDKTVRAEFRYIYAPVASGVKALNRSFSQAEYINILKWENNPANAGLTISAFRIYVMSGSTATLLDEVGPEVTEYWHRKAGSDPRTYRIQAITSGGREGAPAEVTI